MGNLHRKRAEGNLLIVDDELSSRQTLKAFPTGEGYEVGCAASGSIALPFCVHFNP
jgi:CheY-like chemotaxis protein